MIRIWIIAPEIKSSARAGVPVVCQLLIPMESSLVLVALNDARAVADPERVTVVTLEVHIGGSGIVVVVTTEAKGDAGAGIGDRASIRVKVSILRLQIARGNRDRGRMSDQAHD